MSAVLKESTDKKTVLAKAVLNAAESLGLNQTQLAAVLGVHRTTISRLKTHPELHPATKQGELALLLIRLARGLYALAGGDKEWMKHFMHTKNRITGGIPIEQISTARGLVAVLNLIDALRGKV